MPKKIVMTGLFQGWNDDDQEDASTKTTIRSLKQPRTTTGTKQQTRRTWYSQDSHVRPQVCLQVYSLPVMHSFRLYSQMESQDDAVFIAWTWLQGWAMKWCFKISRYLTHYEKDTSLTVDNKSHKTPSNDNKGDDDLHLPIQESLVASHHHHYHCLGMKNTDLRSNHKHALTLVL